MARIICDYCGTEYDDTEQRCPLCGSIQEDQSAAEVDLPLLDDLPSERRSAGRRTERRSGNAPAAGAGRERARRTAETGFPAASAS